MRNGYIIGTLTSIDNCEIVKMDGKVIQFYEQSLLCYEQSQWC